MSRSVIDTDLGWKRIRQAAMRLDGAGVKVGVRAGKANDGVDIVDYAVWNEFGTEDIPSRPFMRHTADTQERAVGEYTRRLVPGLLDGLRSVDDVLSAVGLWYQARLRSTIRKSKEWARPNSPATIAMKGSSVPLIDTGMLVGAIDFQKVRS